MKQVWELSGTERAMLSVVMRQLHVEMADQGGVCPVPSVELLNAIVLAYNLGRDDLGHETEEGGNARFMVRP